MEKRREFSKKLARLSFSKKLKLLEKAAEKYPELEQVAKQRYPLSEGEVPLSWLLTKEQILELLKEITEQEKGRKKVGMSKSAICELCFQPILPGQDVCDIDLGDGQKGFAHTECELQAKDMTLGVFECTTCARRHLAEVFTDEPDSVPEIGDILEGYRNVHCEHITCVCVAIVKGSDIGTSSNQNLMGKKQG